MIPLTRIELSVMIVSGLGGVLNDQREAPLSEHRPNPSGMLIRMAGLFFKDGLNGN